MRLQPTVWDFLCVFAAVAAVLAPLGWLGFQFGVS